jgi:hypothetical protein
MKATEELALAEFKLLQIKELVVLGSRRAGEPLQIDEVG